MKKRTNTILIGAVVAALLFITVAVVSAKSILAEAFKEVESVELSGEEVERSFAVGDFSGVSVSGGWRLTISEGPSHSLRIAGDSVLVETATVDVEGDALVLRAEGVAPPFSGGLRADVQVPRLTTVRSTGGSDILLRNVTAEELSITNSGASSLRAEGGTIRRLEVDSEGAANIEFSSAEVYEADIVLEGAGNVELSMTGGELTGRISGVGNVEYSGTVRREAIRIDGVGSVERREAD